MPRKRAVRIMCARCRCVVRIPSPGLGPDRDGAYCPCGIFHRRKGRVETADDTKILDHELKKGTSVLAAKKMSRKQKRILRIWAGEKSDDVPLIGMPGYELKEKIDVSNSDA